MNAKQVIKKLSPKSDVDRQDLSCLTYQILHGHPFPFFSDDLSTHVSIQKVFRLNQNYDLVVLSNEKEHPLSRSTLEKWVNYQWSRHEEGDTCCRYSKNFRKHIQTSFAILKHGYVKLWPLMSHIDKLELGQQTKFIAIDGMAASGKTTLAGILAHLFKGIVVHTDDFYKKADSNLNDPIAVHGSHIDFDKINQTVIDPLKRMKDLIYRPFDHQLHRHLEPVMISYRPVVFIEGAYSTHPYMNVTYDYRIWVKTSYVCAIIRIWKRNGIKRLKSFIHRWIPLEQKYKKALHLETQADFILKT